MIVVVGVVVAGVVVVVAVAVVVFVFVVAGGSGVSVLDCLLHNVNRPTSIPPKHQVN